MPLLVVVYLLIIIVVVIILPVVLVVLIRVGRLSPYLRLVKGQIIIIVLSFIKHESMALFELFIILMIFVEILLGPIDA